MFGEIQHLQEVRVLDPTPHDQVDATASQSLESGDEIEKPAAARERIFVRLEFHHEIEIAPIAA